MGDPAVAPVTGVPGSPEWRNDRTPEGEPASDVSTSVDDGRGGIYPWPVFWLEEDNFVTVVSGTFDRSAVKSDYGLT